MCVLVCLCVFVCAVIHQWELSSVIKTHENEARFISYPILSLVCVPGWEEEKGRVVIERLLDHAVPIRFGCHSVNA